MQTIFKVDMYVFYINLSESDKSVILQISQISWDCAKKDSIGKSIWWNIVVKLQ